MKRSDNLSKPLNSKGAVIFKKMPEDKPVIHEHLKKGGKLRDIKDKYWNLENFHITLIAPRKFDNKLNIRLQ